MTHPTEPEPLQPMLEEVEAELEQRLEKVCELSDVREESTGEYMRLEEQLLEAAQAAKQAFSLRRRLRAQRESDETEAPPAKGAGGPAAIDGAVRTITDGDGTEWRVWAVTPQRMRSNPATSEHLGDYKDGWLAFERTDGSQRRRLPLYPGEWERVSPNELLELLARAKPARMTKRDD